MTLNKSYDKKKSLKRLPESMSVNCGLPMTPAGCSGVTGNKFDDVRIYLEHMETELYRFLGERLNASSKGLSENIIAECAEKTRTGTMSVQEAVSTVFNRYRSVLQEDSRVCRKMGQTNASENAKRAELVRMMNMMETSTWENEWYQLMPYIPLSPLSRKYLFMGNESEENEEELYETILKNSQRLLEERLNDNHKKVAECRKDHKMETNCSDIVPNIDNTVTIEDNTNQCSTDNVAMKDNVFPETLLTRPIDGDLEQAFLHEMEQNGDDICSGKFNDRDTEEALELLLGDGIKIETVDPFNDNNSEENTCAEWNENQQTKEQSANTIPETFWGSTKDDGTTNHENSVFAKVLKEKCRTIGKNLTEDQMKMLRRCTAQLQDMIQARTLPLSEALENVDKLTTFLVRDAGNAITV